MLNEPLNPGMGLARTAMVKGRVSPEALAELDAALAGRIPLRREAQRGL